MNKERPILNNLVKLDTLQIERFQNNVLRPIIKMQHSFLLIYFKNYLDQNKINWLELKRNQQKEKIELMLQKDNHLKKIITGAIIGHFSVGELEQYINNANELNRRIIQIIIKRLQDSLKEIHKN